jgi:hypothetical protein
LTIDVRIVHDRREKVDRLNDGEIVRETIDPRIVVGFGPDEKVGISYLG